MMSTVYTPRSSTRLAKFTRTFFSDYLPYALEVGDGACTVTVGYERPVVQAAYSPDLLMPVVSCVDASSPSVVDALSVLIYVLHGWTHPTGVDATGEYGHSAVHFDEDTFPNFRETLEEAIGSEPDPDTSTHGNVEKQGAFKTYNINCVRVKKDAYRSKYRIHICF